MAALAAEELGLKKFKINKAIKFIKNVNGRLELVKKYPNNVRVFIDYAHTPEALREVITSVKESFNNNISLVFGCGGERDFKKRPLMAKIAKSLCKTYVTDDNPRNENPAKIRKEIVFHHLKEASITKTETDLKQLKNAILNAEPDEVQLLLVKVMKQYKIMEIKFLISQIKRLSRALKLKEKNIKNIKIIIIIPKY